MRYSIITPTVLRASLKRLCDSIDAQIYDGWEHLVVVDTFDRGEFDLVYIDGNHDVESVSRDADLARSLRPSRVAFHDWDFPSVREGACQVFEEALIRVVGSVAVFKC